MTITEFLVDRLGRIVLQAFFAAASAVFLRMTGTETGIIVLLLAVWFLAAAGVQAYDFHCYHSYFRELEAIMDGLDKKYLFAECVPKPRNVYERRWIGLFQKAGRAMLRAVSDAQASQREYREYVEGWVHEIKAPITAAGLVCRNADSGIRHKLLRELAQIEAHVERALFYARAESPEKDFLIRQAGLEDIAAQAVSNHRALLMQSDVRVETEDLGQAVYTDVKWAVFILGQLLQNAVRYRSGEPVVTLSARQLGKHVQLAVCDNGIGIPEHELSRICERGFTGSNGRTRGGATGMGLYLCRKLADCLEIDLQIASRVGEGTRVVLTFPEGGQKRA